MTTSNSAFSRPTQCPAGLVSTEQSVCPRHLPRDRHAGGWTRRVSNGAAKGLTLSSHCCETQEAWVWAQRASPCSAPFRSETMPRSPRSGRGDR